MTGGGTATNRYDAIILAGGAGARLGGVDKGGLEVAGSSMLGRVLSACADARAVAIAGRARPTNRPVRWALEQPPGGGPLAGLGAGLSALPPDADAVVVLACDLPYLASTDVARLLARLPGHDAAVFTDAAGIAQPTAAAYRAATLRTALRAVGSLAGQPVRRILAGMRIALVDDHGAARDCDTPAQLAAARMALR